jgi:hypothetical protein
MDTKTSLIEMLNSIEKSIEALHHRQKFIGKTQLLIVQHLSDKDEKFEKQFILQSLMDNKLRKGFTDFVMEQDDCPDNIKTLLMDISMAMEEE